MEYWTERGLDEGAAARLVAEGIADMPALVAWLAAHPNGTETIGRVLMTELAQLAEAA